MAETLRVYPERPLIAMFLSAYEQGAWKDAGLNWIEEAQENAVEVIATRADGTTLALEHTLVELFAGEKYDSTIFTEAFASRIDKNPELTIPGRALDVMIPVGGLAGVKDRDAAGEALLRWLKANHDSIPPGDSEQIIMVGATPLKVRFRNVESGSSAGYCWLGRADKPDTLDAIVEKAIRRKVPKLARTNADRRILLLQREQMSMSETEILAGIEKLASRYPALARVDEVWMANTSIMDSEGWVYLSRLHRGPTQIMRFHKGVLRHLRDDRYGINQAVNESACPLI
jgi:hypothetical protein